MVSVKVVNDCSICCELKLRFYKLPAALVIKTTQLLKRIDLDFKGPLPSVTKNRFILTAVDEFSRFPFAFSCANCDARTMISCLKQLFTHFDMPGYVHSDQGWANYGRGPHAAREIILCGPPALAKTSLIVLIKHVT